MDIPRIIAITDVIVVRNKKLIGFMLARIAVGIIIAGTVITRVGKRDIILGKIVSICTILCSYLLRMKSKIDSLLARPLCTFKHKFINS